MTPHQVSVAGEAFAACLFAQADCDVLVQYGANQPEYDFVAMFGSISRRISVKGSQHPGWGLIQNYKKGRTYHEAAEAWLSDQSSDIVFCLVTFSKVPLGGAPRCYLATPREIANHLKTARNGIGHTILYEDHSPKKGVGKGFRYRIPEHWVFSVKRVKQIMK